MNRMFLAAAVLIGFSISVLAQTTKDNPPSTGTTRVAVTGCPLRGEEARRGRAIRLVVGDRRRRGLPMRWRVRPYRAGHALYRRSRCPHGRRR